MGGNSMFKLFNKPGCRNIMIMHTVGMLMALIGSLLNELEVAGTTWMPLVGMILWGIAEVQLISAVQK